MLAFPQIFQSQASFKYFKLRCIAVVVDVVVVNVKHQAYLHLDIGAALVDATSAADTLKTQIGKNETFVCFLVNLSFGRRAPVCLFVCLFVSQREKSSVRFESQQQLLQVNISLKIAARRSIQERAT